jgi:hypothetical protein
MSLYESDYHQWALKTAAALRSGRLGEVDIEVVAKEIEDLGKTERHKLTNFLVVLITDVVKWEHQQALRSPDRRSSMRENQRRLTLVLEQNPSLRAATEEAIAEAYRVAVIVVSTETQISEQDFPAKCPYAWSELIDYDTGLQVETAAGFPSQLCKVL